MKKTKYLIIGAGITGLSFANFINDDYIICEMEGQAGGLCRTTYCKDYIWDYAGHFFHFADPRLKNFFEEKISSDELVKCKKNTKIYWKNRLIDYPFQKNIHQLPREDFIDCLYDLYFKNEKSDFKNFEDMLYGKFGKAITEKFLKPYNEKLYACNLNNLDVNAMGRFFPYAEIKDIIGNMKNNEDNSYNNFFEYPKNGANVFINALTDELLNENLMFNCKLLKIDEKNKIAHFENCDIQYDYLISSIPFPKLLDCCSIKDASINEDVFSSNKVLVFNIGFDKKSKNTETHWIYFSETDLNFYRVGFYDNILNSNKLSIYVEIGFDSKTNIDIDKELENTLDNLKKVGIIEEHKLVAYQAIIMNPAYVHISSDSQKAVKTIKNKLAEFNIYSIGRYGSWTYCSMEDSMLEAINLVDQLNYASI